MTPYQKTLASKFNQERHQELTEKGRIDNETPVSIQGYRFCWLTSGRLTKNGQVQVQFEGGRRMMFPVDRVWFGERP